jgi:hypothetical protein
LAADTLIMINDSQASWVTLRRVLNLTVGG